MGAHTGDAANHHRELPAVRPVAPAARRFRSLVARVARNLCDGELIPRALFLHLADKPKSLARKGADQNLPLAIVADGATSRVDLAAEGGFRDDPTVPDRGHQVILADDALAILNEIEQEIEGLRLGGDQRNTTPQFPAVCIEQILFERVDHSNPPRLGRKTKPANSQGKPKHTPKTIASTSD